MTGTKSGFAVDGSLRDLGGGKGAVRMDALYPTDPADLWSALTERDRLARWIARVEGDLHLHGRFTASFTSGWTGEGRVDRCEPPHRLRVTMSPDTPDETVIEATCTVEAAGTRLVIEERGIPLVEIGAHGAGWQAHVEDLHRFLVLSAGSDWKARWEALRPQYQTLAGKL